MIALYDIQVNGHLRCKTKYEIQNNCSRSKVLCQRVFPSTPKLHCRRPNTCYELSIDTPNIVNLPYMKKIHINSCGAGFHTQRAR